MAYIEQQRARTNRNLLITGIVLISVVALVFVGAGNYFRNFFAGPFHVDDKGLAAIDDWRTA